MVALFLLILKKLVNIVNFTNYLPNLLVVCYTCIIIDKCKVRVAYSKLRWTMGFFDFFTRNETTFQNVNYNGSLLSVDTEGVKDACRYISNTLYSQLCEMQNLINSSYQQLVDYASLDPAVNVSIDSPSEVYNIINTAIEKCNESINVVNYISDAIIDYGKHGPNADGNSTTLLTMLTSPNYMPFIDQRDYANVAYAGKNVKTSGCGITSLCMVASYFTGSLITPDLLAPYVDRNSGDNVERMTKAADLLNINWTCDNGTSLSELKNYLSDGKIVICLVRNSGHFVVCRGITEDGKVLVNDPYGAWAKSGAYTDAELNMSAGRTWIFDVDENKHLYGTGNSIVNKLSNGTMTASAVTSVPVAEVSENVGSYQSVINQAVNNPPPSSRGYESGLLGLFKSANHTGATSSSFTSKISEIFAPIKNTVSSITQKVGLSFGKNDNNITAQAAFSSANSASVLEYINKLNRTELPASFNPTIIALIFPTIAAVKGIINTIENEYSSKSYKPEDDADDEIEEL